MKNLILLILVTACASSQPYDYQEYVIEQTSADLKQSVEDFGISVKELEAAICRDYPHDEHIQEELCNK